MAGLAESVARDVQCGCLDGTTGATAHDAMRLLVEAALDSPNYTRALWLFAAKTEEADATTDRHIDVVPSFKD